MSFVLLGACLTLAAFALAATAASPLTLVAFHRLRRQGAAADALLWARATASGLAALFALGLVLPAYLAFEPLHAERPGPALMLAAAAGAALLGAGGVRLFRAQRATRALLRTRGPGRLPAETARLVPPGLPAETIAHGFPLVAVVGTVTPRLVMATQVVEALDPAEMAVVVRHEAAHLAARDNLKALLIRAMPDPLAMLPCGRHLEASWRQAVEAEADASAAAPGSPAALDLASALIKIARLVPSHRPLPVAEPALYDGGPLSGRVERLTGPASAGRGRRPRRLGWALGMAVGSVAAATASTPVLFHVHGAIETLVRALR